MSDTVIRAEGLGKKYLIGHDTERERYTALRDVVGRNVRNLARSARDMVRGRQLVMGDEVEEFWALKDVSFEIKRGEVVGIIGRNGAGKSTLLKILSRITEPSAGRVEIRGRVASLLEVGTGFHPELTGRENIYLNGAILGMTRAEIKRKFDEIVDFAGVEKFLDTPVKRYSSGMYVRLAFAVAAHLEPEILVVDEVLAVGDAEFQKKCLGKMGEVAKGGRTVLFVSHNMRAVAALTTRGILLNCGTIALLGTAKAAIDRYTNDCLAHNDLASLTARSGNGDIRFTRVRFRNASSDTLVSGQDAVISFSYTVQRHDAVNKPLEVGLTFYDPFERAMFAVNTSVINFDGVVKKTGNTECLIRRLPLAPGRYTYSVFSRVNKQIADYIPQAGIVDVRYGDYYGTGRLPLEDQQVCYVDYEWIS